MDILGQIVRGHVDVTNGNRQAQDLRYYKLVKTCMSIQDLEKFLPSSFGT